MSRSRSLYLILTLVMIAVLSVVFVACNINTGDSCEHEYDYVIKQLPTMDAEGSMTVKCSKCELNEEIIIPSLSDMSTWSWKVESKQSSSCEQGGIVVYTSIRPYGGIVVEINTEARGHVLSDLVAEVPSTCTVHGVKAHKECSECGKYFDADGNEITSLELPLADHKIGDLIAEVPSTCISHGVAAHKECSECGKLFDADGKAVESLELPLADHNFGDLVAKKDSTCSAIGTKAHYVCSVCGVCYDENKENELDDLIIPVKDHKYEEKEILEATCCSVGTKQYTCTECGHVYYEEIAKTDKHTPEVLEGYDATCWSKGLTEGSYCSVCGKILQEQKEIDKLEHKYSEEPTETIEATCISEGYKYYTCSLCGDVKVETIVKKEHELEKLEGYDATCTEPGLSDGEICSYCGTITKKQEVIQAEGHTKDNGVKDVEPTCTEAGSMLYTCNDCGETWAYEIPALGHKHETVEGISATCTVPGLSDGEKCSECGEILVAQTVVPALGHDWDDGEIIVQVTCTHRGEISHECSRCDASYIEYINATGHSYSEAWSYDGTNHFHKCDNCDAVSDKTSHKDNNKDHKCDVCGYTMSSCVDRDKNHSCDYCGASMGTHVQAAGKHTCDYCGEVMSAHEGGTATCKESATCTVCGQKYGAKDPANHVGHIIWVTDDTYHQQKYDCCNLHLGAKELHDLNENNVCTVCGHGCKHSHTAHTAGLKATCTEDGHIEYWTCSDCSTKFSDSACTQPVADVKIPAKGHSLGSLVSAKEPNCTEAGYHAYYQCSACSVYFDANRKETTWADLEIVALGHNSDGVIAHKDANCTESGVVGGTYCTRCNDGKAAAETVINALGHNYGDWIVEIPASCTEEGTLGHYHCSECNIDFDINKVILTNLVINKVNHTPAEAVRENEQDANCTEKGHYDSVVYCSECGDELSREPNIEIPVKGHSYGDWIAEIPATCGEPGVKGHKDCSVCNKHFDNEGNEIFDLSIAADNTAHVWSYSYDVDNHWSVCANCNATKDSEAHSDADEDGICDICKVDMSIVAIFQFGENGKASHVEGIAFEDNKYSEIYNEYTLSLTGSNAYKDAFDALGNSALKLGASKKTGSISFTVPDDITVVVIYVAKYKNNNTKISINGAEYTVSTSSNDGIYTAYEVDTSSVKSVTLNTISGNTRCMIDKIEFYNKHVCSSKTLTHTLGQSATCTEAGNIEYWSCSVCDKIYTDADCKTELTDVNKDGVVDVKDTVIAALGHNYGADGKCQNEGCTSTANIVYLNTNIWNVDNAWFAVYYWDDNGNYWTEMTVYSENSTVYSAMLPEDISNIIFVRMNENKHDFDWASKDNQSQNITLSDGNSYYVVKDWNGSDDGKSTVILVNSYTLVGTGIFGDEWNANNSANDLLYDAKTGLYTKTYDDVDLSGSFEYKIAINHDWDVSYGWNDSYSSDFMGNDGNFKATLSGESKVTFTLNIFTLKIECNIHTHVWNWKNDTTSHKQVCECGATKNEGEHNYVDGKCECGANDPDNYISVDIADLQDGSSPYIDKQVEFTGTVTKIYTAWNDSYNNMSVIVSDNNGNGVLVFRTTEKLEVCDVVTVKGKFFYYTDDEKPANNKYEIDVGSIVTKTGDNHVWTEANCTDPKTCSVCGKTEGEANGHIDENPKDGICDVCKEDISLQSVTIAYTGSTDNMSGDNDAKLIFGLDDNIFNIYSTKTGNYHVGLNKSGVIRLYKNETSLFNISVSSNYQIVKITINTNSLTLSVKSGDKTITKSNGVYEINGSSLVISNTGSSSQDIKSIVVYYREAQSSGGDEHVCAENKIHHEAVSPTCTEDGTIEYWSCSKCDKKYSDEACTKEITSIVDPKIAHSYSESDWIAEVSAKCNEDGEKGHYYCSTCKKNYDIDGKELPSLVISKTGEHTYNDEGICSVCGKNKNESTTVTVNIGNYATNKNWSNGTLYDSIIMDSNITVTAMCAYPNEHGQNTGKYYTSGNQWRIYQNETPSLTISANAGYTIVSAKINYAANNDGVLTLNGSNIESGKVVEVNGSSITFGVGNTGDKTNGQARITAIEVVYKSSSSSGGTDTPHTHEWELDTTKGANGYEWSADGSSCIAHAKCSDADCTETTTATASITSEETKSATCKEYGEITYTATFTESWATTQTNVIKGSTYAAHTLTANPAKDATCTEAGNIAYWYCSVCEKYFTDEACTTELTDVNKDGKVDGEDAEIAALGHNYVINKDLEGSVDGYIWNADYTECVANGICSRCDDTTTVKSIAVTINDSDSSPATCKEYSKTVYVAEFDDEATWYCEQRYTVTGTTLADHDYDSDDICKVCHEKDPSKVFYLIGCIDGYDYGCEGDWENLGVYEFADGCVEVIFTKDSYVFVKAKTNSAWYMTDGWLGTDVQSAILYNTNKGLTNANKLFVPGNSVVTFTLIYDRENDTIELSYTWVCQTHNWNDATCTAPKTCSVCGATEGTALGHSVGEWIEAAGTCQSAAVIGHYECKTCGVNLASDKQNVITNIVGDKNPDNHEGTLSTEWQKDASGHWHVYSCCGVKTDEAAHTPDHEGSATEEYAIKCKDCDYVIEAQLNHTHKYGEVKYTLSEDWSKCFATRTCSGCAEGVDGHTQTATATEINWYSQTVNCTQDGTVDYYLTFAEEDSWAEPSDKVSIPMAALGHDPSHHKETPAEYNKAGNIEYWSCSRSDCGKYFSDAECTKKITDKDSVVIPALNRVYFTNTIGWENVYIYAWVNGGSDTTGWSDHTMTKGSDNQHYYDLESKYDMVIFHNNNGTQTLDLSISYDDDNKAEFDPYVRLYFYNYYENHDSASIYAWKGDGESKKQNAEWPGVVMTRESDDSDWWYTILEKNRYEKVIFNNSNNGSQTANLDPDYTNVYCFYGSWVNSKAPTVSVSINGSVIDSSKYSLSYQNQDGGLQYNVKELSLNIGDTVVITDYRNATYSYDSGCGFSGTVSRSGSYDFYVKAAKDTIWVSVPAIEYTLNGTEKFVVNPDNSNELKASIELIKGASLIVKDNENNTYSDWENSGFLSDDNTVIHSGTYDLYFKLDSKKIYVTAPGHTLGDLHDKQGGNCYQDGNQAYYQCECGAYFDADENETTWDALYIPVTHSYGEIKYEFNRVVSDPNSEESYDYWVCKATRECTVSGCSKGNDGHTQIATSVKVDQDITQHADCTKPELSTLTATFTETWVGENGVYVETSHQTAGITSHTMTTDQPMPAVNATCTSTGLKEACYYCSVCEKYFDDHAGQNELTDVVIDIDANNHASIEIKHSDTQHWNFCTSCNTEIVGTRANHDLVDGTCECGYGCTHTNVTHTPAKTANCTESGNDEYYYCSTCKKYFADKDCTTAFSGKLNISALGHDTEGVAWSIGESQHWKVCNRCNQDVDIADHNTNGLVEHKDPDCINAGVVGGTYCSICNYGKDAAEKPITALGHSIVLDTAQGTDGYSWGDNYSTCTAYGKCDRTGCTHTVTATATASGSVTQNKSCILPELTKYTATFSETWADTQIQENIQTAAATGHSIVLDTTQFNLTAYLGYTWESNFSKCTAHGKCENCDYITTAEATVLIEKTDDATCKYPEFSKSTATFNVDWAKSQYVGNIKTNDALGHDTEGVDWSSDGTNHWKVCTRCKEKVDSAAHTYDKEILDSKYLKSEANCSSAAVYYKSCICGAHEENVDNTFTNGDIDSSNHIFSQDWTSDDSKHWHKCTNTNCDAISDEAEHTYSEDDHYCECGKFDPSLLVGTADLKYSYTSNAYSVTGYSGSATSVTIPSYYDDGKNGIHQVTAIGENAFNKNNNTNISAITLPSSVTTIGNFAFYQSNLTSIDLSNVTSLGKCAFAICQYLYDVKLSSNLSTLPFMAFGRCGALQSIDLSYIDTIGDSAFWDSVNLASITIKNGVTIEADAFYETKLTSITFVNDDTISTTAFSGLSTLTSITFNISDTTNLSYMLDSIPTAFANNSIPDASLTVSFPNISMNDLGTSTQNQNNETCWFDSLINGSDKPFKIECSGDIVLTYTPAKSAGTCQEPGNIAYFTNSIDSKNYSFSKTAGWVEESNVTIAGAHNWSDATCTAPKTCSLCGATDGEADSNAHNYSSYIADGDGSHTLVCSYDFSHTKTENCYGGEEATCLKKSLCEVCKQYYGSYAEHEYGDWTDEVPATCSATGTKGHKDCTVCSKHFDIDGNEISDLTINKVDDAHNYVAVEGVSNLYKCSYCNKEFKASSTSTWELLTDVSNLKAGSRIIIVGINKEIYYALNTNQKSNNRGASEIKVTTNDDGSISFTISESADANVQIINIVSGTKDGTFAFNVDSGYLYAANSSSNQLKTEEILSDNSSWSISVTSNGVASIIAQGTNTRNVLRFNYNNGTPLINCYSSTSDYAIKADYNVYIYIENVTYTYTEICENSENHVCSKDNVLDATCTADGVCSICGRTVEDSKLGHTYDEDDYIYNNDATCQKAGTKTATCGRCGLTDTIEDSEHPITSHVYDKDGNCTYNCGTQCNVVYLDTNMWNADSAWFAARFWNDSGEKWVKMSVYNDNGIYYAFVPADMTKVIFVRMNKDATALSFDSKWNQSQDIELSLVDNKAHYTVFAYGENGANSTISNSYIAAGGISDSDGGLFGTAWNISSTDNPNVLKYNSNSSEPGIYSIFYENVSNAGKHGVKVVVNSSWNVNYGDNGNNVEFTVAAGDNVLITFNFFTKEVKAQDHTHSYTYTINEDGTHNGICSCCSTISNESHTYAKGYCVCGKLDETYYFPKNIADLSALEDGTKVEFTGTVVKVTSSNNVTVSDGNGNTFYIYNPDTSSLSESIEQCDCITVKGVIGTYNDDKQISAGATITIAAEKNHTISEEWSFDSANHYHVCGICFTHFDESGHADDDNDGKCDKCEQIMALKTLTISISGFANINNWVSGTAYTDVKFNSIVSASVINGGNNGKYYSSDTSWRFYNGGELKFSQKCVSISFITFVFSGGSITYNGSSYTSNSKITISENSLEFSFTKTTKITSISFEYIQEDHTSLTYVSAVDSTCDKVGNIEYWECSTCGKKYSNEACSKEVTDVTKALIDHVDENSDGTCDKCGNAIGDEGNAGTETGGSDSGDGETATQTNYEYTTTDKLTSGTLSWGE